MSRKQRASKAALARVKGPEPKPQKIFIRKPVFFWLRESDGTLIGRIDETERSELVRRGMVIEGKNSLVGMAATSAIKLFLRSRESGSRTTVAVGRNENSRSQFRSPETHVHTALRGLFVKS